MVAFYSELATDPLHLHTVCVANRDGPHGNWHFVQFIYFLYDSRYTKAVNMPLWDVIHFLYQLEQLERLRSDDTLRRLMITHDIESYWNPSQQKTK